MSLKGPAAALKRSCNGGATRTIPKRIIKIAEPNLNTESSIPIAKPIVATNSPMATKEIATPSANSAGPNLCRDAAAPRTSGSNGNTQGERIDKIPARNASPMAPMLIFPASQGFIEQGGDRRGVGVADGAARLGRALEDDQCALHRRLELAHYVLLIVEIHAEDF